MDGNVRLEDQRVQGGGYVHLYAPLISFYMNHSIELTIDH